MVAVQMLLMNYFLLGLHTESHFSNDVLPPEDLMPCSFGCSKCSLMNGCYACKPPFLLTLHRVGHQQPGVCKRDCPKGFFGSYRGKEGFCIQCEIQGCKVCASRHFCIGCQRGKVLFNGRCKKKCPIGFSYDPYKKSCSREKKEINGTSVGFSLDRRVNLQSVLYSTKQKLKKEERRLWKEKRRSMRRRKKKEKRKRMRLKKEKREEIKRARRRHHRRKKRRKQRRKKMKKFSFKNSTNPS